MGMDLKPVNAGAVVAPMMYPDCPWDLVAKWGRYNLSGWSALAAMCAPHGIELPGLNDGDLINQVTCLRIAEILDESNDPFWQGHANWWRTCGGCYVY